MLKVQCSRLEEVRKNPSSFVQQLLSEEKSRNGSHGMFARWQNRIRAIHSEDVTVPQAVKGLQQQFMTYADNKKNKKKQEFLLDRLYPYLEEYTNREFVYEGGQVRIFWNILQDVALTGNSPILASNQTNEEYSAYFFTESPSLWKHELKYPLLQKYLSEEYFDCEYQQLQIGNYCLQTNSFDLLSYSDQDIDDAFMEAQELFTQISNEYNAGLGKAS